MPRWGMVIDLQRCIGCYSCMISCKQEHFLPPDVYWNRVIIGEIGKYPAVRKQIYPVLCNHCQDPLCVKVCPTGATTQREDGIIFVDYDKCMGCRYCLVACPYQQRTYLSNHKREYFPGQGLTEYEQLGQQLYCNRKKGVLVKCDFCLDRIKKGMEKGLNPGVDREATPACVIACPANARYFGDLDEPDSEVSRKIRKKKGIQLHPEFGTEPSVYYLSY